MTSHVTPTDKPEHGPMNPDLTDVRIQQPPIQFISKIGGGGTAEVWKAKEINGTNRIVAAKVISFPFEERSSKKNRGKLEEWRTREMAAWQAYQGATEHVLRLNQPISDTATIGDVEYLLFGFTMDYSEYGDLDAFRRSKYFHGLSVRDYRSFFESLSMALSMGHAIDQVHGDVKPHNALVFYVDNRFKVKLMDFGCAYGTADLTKPGLTPQYLAPERFPLVGGYDTTPTEKSDVYALGILFYYFITGRHPIDFSLYSAKATDLMFRRGHYEHEIDYSKLNEFGASQFEVLIRRMLNRNPRERIGLNQVKAILKAQDADSVAAVQNERLRAKIVPDNTFVWAPKLHDAFGHMTKIYFLSSHNLQSGLVWIRNRLSQSGFDAYTMWRTVGTRDYMLLLRGTHGDFERLEDKFVKAYEREKIGRLSECQCSQEKDWKWPSKRQLKIEEKIWANSKEASRAIADVIVASKDLEDATIELKRQGLVRCLVADWRPDNRITVVLCIALERGASATLKSLVFESIGGLLEEATGPDKPKRVKGFQATGTYDCVFLFDIKKFFYYKEIVDGIIRFEGDTPEVSLTFETFLGLDKAPIIQSDDGDIVVRASAWARENNYEFGVEDENGR